MKSRRRKLIFSDLARNLILLIGGLLGVAHETLLEHGERPTLLILFAGMMGLPAFLPQGGLVKQMIAEDIAVQEGPDAALEMEKDILDEDKEEQIGLDLEENLSMEMDKDELRQMIREEFERRQRIQAARKKQSQRPKN